MNKRMTRLEKLEHIAQGINSKSDTVHACIDGEDVHISFMRALDIVLDEEYLKQHDVKFYEKQERGCGLLGALLDGLTKDETT